ncbi:MAG: hypothetical protein AB8H79_22600 [Myxococcota bacterium]
MTESEVMELLGSVTGRELSVTKTDPITTAGAGAMSVCTFVNDSGEIAALLVADLGLATSLGACLTGMEPEVVAAALSAGVMGEEESENWGEIARVCAQIIRLPGSPTWSFGQALDPQSIGEGVSDTMASAAMRAGWNVSVPGYGAGRLSAMWMSVA